MICVVWLSPIELLAQQRQDRIDIIQQKLDDLSVTVPGLNEKVQLNLSGVTIRDYINTLSKVNKLSISLDPQLSFVVSESVNNVSASNVLTFLAKKYNLDLEITGSIIYLKPFSAPVINVPIIARNINVKYSQLENALSVDLKNDSLVAVARKITQVSGKNVQVPVAMQSKLVSGFIANAPFDSAIEQLAFLNEVKAVKTNDNFYIFQPLLSDEENYITGDKSVATRKVFKPVTPVPNTAPSGLMVRTINGQKFISVDVTNVPIADLIRQAAREVGKQTITYSEIKGNIQHFDINDVSFDNFLSLLFKGTDYTFQIENGVYMIGESKLEGLRASRTIQLQHRTIDSVMALIPAEWRKGVQISEFREQNSLIISGASSRIHEMETFIKHLDVLVPVVLIEVTLIDIHKNRTVATGISAGVADSVKTGGTLLSGMDFTFGSGSINGFLDKIGSMTSTNLGHVVPNFYVNIKALEANNNVEVRSVPKMTALNGHTATLSIGNKVYYRNVTQNVIPSSANVINNITTQFMSSEANLTIGFKPLISGDDQVTLGINVDISDFTAIPADGSPPPTSSSKFQSSIRVNNEDMIVLGGIERTERSDNASGIPLLSRIPILKWIFSSKKKTNGKVVTLVFIKPTILR